MLELWLFTADPAEAARAAAAGIGGIVVDWECAGKQERQRGAGLECNRDTAEDLSRVRGAVRTRVVCRINACGGHTSQEVESALAAGADLLLLPMVRGPQEVERYLRLVDGRTEAGILVETAEAVACARELAALPVACAYVGLNDLALSRRSRNIFEAVTDGTVEAVRDAFAGVRFGFGGATVVDGGAPVPFRLLLGEMARLRCDFGFLRRSFKREVRGRDLAAEVSRIHDAFGRAGQRSQAEITADRQALGAAVSAAAAAASPEPRVGPAPPPGPCP